MGKIKIEVQYFNGCPNSEEMLKTVKKIVEKAEYEIDFEKLLVESQEAAERYKFRGSPTILINGKDVENLPENPTPSLSCRYYPNGLPITSDIEKVLKEVQNIK